MPKLNASAAAYLQKILKHYPIPDPAQKDIPLAHKYPQQHMHDYRKERQIYDRPTSEKLDSMKMFKDEGNNHYKNQRYKQASYFYQKVIIYGDYTFPEQQKDCLVLEELLQQANCNLGMCQIKINQWDTARIHLNEASKGKNMKVKSKALYWLTKYYIRISEFLSATNTIRQIQLIGSPHNQSIQQLEKLLKYSEQTNDISEKKLCSNMFK